MISVGFDPSFIDIIIKTYDAENNLRSKLPPPGYHNRNIELEKIAGGNGINLAYVLNKLDVPIKLVVPTNKIFNQLLNERNLSVFLKIHKVVNETYAIVWGEGEIQFNHIVTELSFNDWTEEVHNAWISSPIHVYQNWGLNPKSLEWVALQWLGTCGWKYNELPKQLNLVETAFQANSPQKPIFLDPGSLKLHKENKKLKKLLSKIGNTEYNNLFPILLFNEEEKPEFERFSFPTKIFHNSKHVLHFTYNSMSEFKVPPINNIKTLVGAGDAFLAGLIAEYLTRRKIDIKTAIKVAGMYISDNL